MSDEAWRWHISLLTYLPFNSPEQGRQSLAGLLLAGAGQGVLSPGAHTRMKPLWGSQAVKTTDHCLSAVTGREMQSAVTCRVPFL
jgi:hypothetical protein